MSLTFWWRSAVATVTVKRFFMGTAHSDAFRYFLTLRLHG